MGKLWNAFRAQMNKLTNFFWGADPIAQMQLEYDKSVAQLKEGREGLEKYRAMVERVTRQVETGEKKVEQITAKIKAYLKAGQREAAARSAVQLNEAKKDLEENRKQLALHEVSYQNNVDKIKFASKNLAKVREKINKYEADLKMSEAEAQMAQLSQSFDFDVTTDFGQVEQIVQEKIDLNRAKTRVASDMSSQGLEDIQAEKVMEQAMAEDLLSQFEVEMGLKTPETAELPSTTKELGPEKVTE
ncbi:MAG: PspA/IM30 family protein [Deltaproteobacteria bacterium]|nr:PspA/IM30 family protein [Deltaproteobacteria bacterium]